MRCSAIALVPILFLFTFPGCQFLDRQDSEGLFSQEGTLRLSGRSEEEVFYPTPYTRTPNLRLDDYKEQVVVVEQCADRFRIKNLSPAPTNVKWIARGAIAPTESTPPPPTPIPSNP